MQILYKIIESQNKTIQLLEEKIKIITDNPHTITELILVDAPVREEYKCFCHTCQEGLK